MQTSPSDWSPDFSPLADDIRIFISYKTENVGTVRAIVDFLRANRVAVWFAEYEVLSDRYEEFDSTLDESLQAAIESCTHAVIFSNATWARSSHCRNELQWVTNRFQSQPQHVIHVLMPEEPLVYLSDQEQDALESFPKYLFPETEGGWIEAARHLLRCFVPNQVPITVIEATTGQLYEFSQQGYWGRVRLSGVAVSESLQDYIEHSHPERARHWSGSIADIPVVITVDITPRQTLLTPWELAHRQSSVVIPTSTEGDIGELDSGRIPQCLMDSLQNMNIRLADTWGVSIILPGMEWKVQTGTNSFIVKRSFDELHVYPGNTEVIDDRTVYQHLRRAASDWLRGRQVEEHGLHLFWHRQLDNADAKESDYSRLLGKMALTCLERDSAGKLSRWARCYLLMVIDPWSGAIGQVTFTVSMPCSGDDSESSFRRFMQITPQCDRIATSLQYFGAPQARWPERVFTAAFSSAVAVGLLFVLLPDAPTWLKFAAGGLWGLAMTPSLLRRTRPADLSVKHAPHHVRHYHSHKYGFSLTVPLGWCIHRGLFAKLLNRLGDVEVRCVPIGKQFPQLAVNAACLNPSGNRRSDLEQTRAFQKRARQAIDQRLPLQAAQIESTSEILVDAVPAFELVYSRPSVGGRTGFYKVGLFHNGKQFYIQGSCEDLDREISAMRSVVQSIRFDKPSMPAV